ncbi:hypothetical protein [uncultured Dechloromonas sp.]|uniref:hypothetical protein n=1 Tax=uncultured Dechloromonas sp. TaxID=171719 RepID=UPI0025DA7C2A|nr:hypothetical protein [uncultured Dechloromonas sp.]
MNEIDASIEHFFRKLCTAAKLLANGGQGGGAGGAERPGKPVPPAASIRPRLVRCGVIGLS